MHCSPAKFSFSSSCRCQIWPRNRPTAVLGPKEHNATKETTRPPDCWAQKGLKSRHGRTKGWFGPVHRLPILPSRQWRFRTHGATLFFFRSDHPWPFIRRSPVLRRLHVGFVTWTSPPDPTRIMPGQCWDNADVALTWPTPCHSSTPPVLHAESTIHSQPPKRRTTGYRPRWLLVGEVEDTGRSSPTAASHPGLQPDPLAGPPFGVEGSKLSRFSDHGSTSPSDGTRLTQTQH
jgi:hypothetical protein